MRIIGDTDRTQVYTLAELEKKERLESVLATECDIFNFLGLDPKDKETRREAISKVMKKHAKKHDRTGKCKCPIKKFKQRRMISLREYITYNSGKCDLDGAEVGYIIPKNTALGMEFRSLLILIRQIVISEKNSGSTPIEFFAMWLAINIFIVIFLYFERLFRMS
ncbi:hypothetical protein NEHOM01_1222 [Nematocida homosporus]|uniref:uncharacterized protein n=1 Tax=Nematocida homosporus TaxID=1912981 RepID=UPI00221E95DA|nr:uncharacterized protein NEHOM01_1222 [Nematocida homosporus]KAI5186019.1 hypothetical protein NEHOM01_1222 [Nematocida homosporus]